MYNKNLSSVIANFTEITISPE